MSEFHVPKGRGMSNYAQAKATVTVSTNGTTALRAHVKHPTEGWNEQQLVIAMRADNAPMPTSQREAIAVLWDALGQWLWSNPPVAIRDLHVADDQD